MQEDFDLLETLSQYSQVAIYNIMLYKKLEKENIRFEKEKV
jgi:GAF domain-containing protein